MNTLESGRCPKCGKSLPDEATACPFCSTITSEFMHDDQKMEDGYIGRIILNQFLIMKLLGRGGMGTVYEAEHMGLNRKVAVKFLSAADQSDHEKQRFRREALALCAVKHPNIVTMHNFGEMEDDNLFLVMEFVEGETLDSLLKRERIIKPERLVHIIRQVGLALIAIHEKGIVHRDLKPNNIMLTHVPGVAYDFVKILDFGISKLMLHSWDLTATAKGVIFGTPEYMSPEQVAGKEIDGRSDLYSLGLIIYRALTGNSAYEANTPMAYMMAHCNETPKPIPTEIQKDLSKELLSLLARVLAKDIKVRPTSATEFIRLLESTPEFRQTVVLPAIGGATKLYLKRPIIYTATVVFFLALFISASYIMFFQGSDYEIENALFKDKLEITEYPGDVAQEGLNAKKLEFVASNETGQDLKNPKSPSFTIPEDMSLIPKGAIYKISGRTGSLLSAFFIDRTEVDFASYNECVEGGLCKQSFLAGNKHFNQLDKPAVGVTFQMAAQFCNAYGKRLPTENEWLAAASFTADIDSKSCCNIKKKEVRKQKTLPVDSTPEDVSIYEVYNLLGNVSEWVEGTENDNKGFTALGWNWSSEIVSDIEDSKIFFLDSEWFGFLGFRCAKDVASE